MLNLTYAVSINPETGRSRGALGEMYRHHQALNMRGHRERRWRAMEIGLALSELLNHR